VPDRQCCLVAAALGGRGSQFVELPVSTPLCATATGNLNRKFGEVVFLEMCESTDSMTDLFISPLCSDAWCGVRLPHMGNLL